MHPNKKKILSWFESEKQKLLAREAKALREKEAYDLIANLLKLGFNLRGLEEPVQNKFDVESLLKQVQFYQLDKRVRSLLEQNHSPMGLQASVLKLHAKVG